MRSRLSPDALLLTGLLVVTLVIAIFAVRSSRDAEPENDFPARRTTFSPNRGGYQAVFEAMRELGYPVRRWRFPLNELKEPGTLIVASPERAVSAAEWRGVLEWVRQGNLLILMVDRGELLGRSTALAELVGARRQPSHAAQPTPVADRAPRLLTRSAFWLNQPARPQPGTSGDEDEEEAAPPGFGTQRGGVGARLLGSAPLVPLYRDAQGVTVALTPWGRGRVVMSSSPWSLSTVGVGQADNFAWLLATIGAYGPVAGVRRSASGAGEPVRTPDAERQTPVWFDEYHHGFGEGRGVLSLLAPIARLGLAQLAVAWLLLAFAASRRFGGRVPDEGRVRRSRSEYLSGMASLLQRARAVDLAVAQVRRQFMNDVARSLGLPRDVQVPVLLAAAAAQGVDAERLRSLLERAERLAQERDRSRQDEALSIARELVEIRSQFSSQRRGDSGGDGARS